MIRTETATRTADSSELPERSHAANVSPAITITMGTNIDATRSARCSMGAFVLWARSIKRPIWLRTVPSPTRVASKTIAPDMFNVPPKTESPGPLSTGTASPVSIDSSTDTTPSRTVPSTATFSPGRTRTRSPTATSSTAIRTSAPSRRTVASFAPSWSKLRMASAARLLERCSKYLPSKRNVMMTPAISK
jgi:hypothetical protein